MSPAGSQSDIARAGGDYYEEDLGLGVRRLQGSILQNSISGENFSDKCSSSKFGQISAQKQHLQIYNGYC
jgi:hypothetical protein